MRGVRNATPLEQCQEKSAQIVSRLLELPEVETAKTIAVFWPMEARHEVDVRALDDALQARGAHVFYPAIDPETRVMTFRRRMAGEVLEERGMGFQEPGTDAEEAGALDVIVVPALAVDTQGYRLGYGAGFYDQALTGTKAFCVCVVYDFQLVVDVPREAHDVATACVVTEARVHRVSSRS